jgi:hypothetical protein
MQLIYRMKQGKMFHLIELDWTAGLNVTHGADIIAVLYPSKRLIAINVPIFYQLRTP